MSDGNGRGAPVDATVPADPLVETMLQKLPIPDHEPAFWDRLTERFDDPTAAASAADAAAVPPGPAAAAAVSATATATTPPPPPPPPPAPRAPLRPDEVRFVAVQAPLLPPRMRRLSNLLLLLLVAAAVTVVAVAATTILRSDTRGRSGQAGPPTTEAADGAADVQGVTGTTAAPAGGQVPPAALQPAEGEPADPGEAAATFVTALGAGSIERAWDLLAPASQRHWEDLERFAAARDDLVEDTFGAFSSTVQVVTSTIVLDDDPPGSATEVGVVVLDAVVRLDATRVRRTLELPYREEGGFGVFRLDPWAPGAGADSPIRFVSPFPADGAPVEYGTVLGTEDMAPIEAAVPAWVEVAVLSVDGEVVEELELTGAEVDTRVDGGTDDIAGRSIRFEPPAPFARGVHRITVAAAGDGQVTAASLLLQTG